MDEAIKELVALSCVAQCSQCSVVCSPLSVVVNGRGKKRLVLDLRYVNQFTLLTKFKYECLNIIPQLFSKGDYFFTFDLKSGYHHVDVHEDCWPYLGISWGSGLDTKWHMWHDMSITYIRTVHCNVAAFQHSTARTTFTEKRQLYILCLRNVATFHSAATTLRCQLCNLEEIVVHLPFQEVVQAPSSVYVHAARRIGGP